MVIDQVFADTPEEWRQWLEAHHGQTASVWLVYPRKGELTYGLAVETALCFGWIDSLPRAFDERRTMLRMSPRKPKTNWSRLNKKRVERLIAERRMHPAGLAKIEAAKLDGSWNALDEVENLVVPPDLADALDRFPPAKENFQAFPRSTQRGILEWILGAKRPETRGRRIEETATLAQRNERAQEWRRRKG